MMATGGSGRAPGGLAAGVAAALGTRLTGSAGEAEAASASARQPPPPPALPGWQPRGALVAHLQEHQRAVNALAVAPDGSYFASASDDATVRVWDCRRLERDILFGSAAAYTGQAGRILCCGALGGPGHAGPPAVASGSSDATVHIWDVEYGAGRGGSATVRPGSAPAAAGAAGEPAGDGPAPAQQLETMDGAVLALQPSRAGAPLVVYTTSGGAVVGWDYRAARPAWQLRAPAAGGLLRRLALDPGGLWAATGSSRGELTVWDLRFRLAAATWRHAAARPLDALALAPSGAGRAAAGGSSGSSGRGGAEAPSPSPSNASAAPLLWLAVEGQALLLDLAAGGAVLDACLLPPAPHGGSELSPAPTAGPPASLATFGLLKGPPSGGPARRPLLRPGDVLDNCGPGPVRALLPLPSGPLLAGHADGCVRRWDPASVDRCGVLCPSGAAASAATGTSPGGPAAGGGRSRYAQARAPGGARITYGLPFVLPPAPAGAPSPGPPLGGGSFQGGAVVGGHAAGHIDAILALALVEGPPGSAGGGGGGGGGGGAQRLLLTAGRDGVVKAWK